MKEILPSYSLKTTRLFRFSTAESCMGDMGLEDEERTLLTNAFTIASHHFTVTVTGQLKAGGPMATIRALIARSPDGSEPASIVSWKEL